uniref:Uncharacterized protein n=1 Tax=Globodera rostochiensis TaxID=31243 RepID=A0A914IDV3_GLORO
MAEYVNIGTDLSSCDDANPNVKVRIAESGVQFIGQNGINMPIYEIERLNSASKTAFNVNMSNKTVRPISQGHTENDDPQFNHRTNRIFYNCHDTWRSQSTSFSSQVEEMEPKQLTFAPRHLRRKPKIDICDAEICDAGKILLLGRDKCAATFAP